MGFTTFDIHTDLLYLEGLEDGEEKGIAKGITKGEQKKAIYSIKVMTANKISISLIAEVAGVELSFVKLIQKQLLQKDKIQKLLKKEENNEVIAEKLKVHVLLVEVLSDELKGKKKEK